MTIYVLSGQNDKFRQKHENLIMRRIIQQQINCLERCDRFCPKILSMTTPRVENTFFSKILQMTS